MTKLMEFISTTLNSIVDTSYQDLPQDDEGNVIIDTPIATYDMPNISNFETTDNISLDIDLWCNAKYFLDMEDISTQIDGKLNELIESNNDFCFYINRKNVYKLYVKDEDKNIKRIQLRYSIQNFKKG